MATTTIDRHVTASETKEAPQETGGRGTGRGKAETELRAAARAHGLTMKELAIKMGVSHSHLSTIATGRRPLTPAMREKVEAVLGKVPGQGMVYKKEGVVKGESSYIRERARELGMSMHVLAERVGVSHGYMTQVSRGRKNMGVKVQKRVESALECPVKVEAASCSWVDREAVWERMEALGISQNEVARRAGLSSAHLSGIMTGKANPSPEVLGRLHRVLFGRSGLEERVMPAEVKVLGWRKGRRQGMVVRGAGGPAGGSIRVGGRVTEGATVEYAFRTGYDGRGRVSTTHVVERGCSGLLRQGEAV